MAELCNECNILSHFQLVIRAERSTESTLQSFTDDAIYAFDKNGLAYSC